MKSWQIAMKSFLLLSTTDFCFVWEHTNRKHGEQLNISDTWLVCSWNSAHLVCLQVTFVCTPSWSFLPSSVLSFLHSHYLDISLTSPICRLPADLDCDKCDKRVMNFREYVPSNSAWNIFIVYIRFWFAKNANVLRCRVLSTTEQKWTPLFLCELCLVTLVHEFLFKEYLLFLFYLFIFYLLIYFYVGACSTGRLSWGAW